MRSCITYIALALLLPVPFGRTAEPERAGDSKPVFAVILPEQVDHTWYWILYSDVSQHIVQARVERGLIRAGLEVVDLSMARLPAFDGNWSTVTSPDFARQVGEELGVDYIVSGYATAVIMSEGSSYGVPVVRSQADITARIIRVGDGRILGVFEESELSGGQSAQAAGRNALKEAAAKLAVKIRRFAAESLESGEPAP